MRISDWSSDVCPSDLGFVEPLAIVPFDRVGSRAQFPAPLETDHVEPHACAEAAPPLRTEFALKIGIALAHGLAIGPEHRDILVLDFACDTLIGRQSAARNRRFPVDRKRSGEGKSVIVRVDIGGSSILKNKKIRKTNNKR